MVSSVRLRLRGAEPNPAFDPIKSIARRIAAARLRPVVAPSDLNRFQSARARSSQKVFARMSGRLAGPELFRIIALANGNQWHLTGL